MTALEFLKDLSQVAKLPVHKAKDFHYVEGSGITVIEQFHKIGIVTTTTNETAYVTPSHELVSILAKTISEAAQSHQQRIDSERKEHLKNMTKLKEQK